MTKRVTMSAIAVSLLAATAANGGAFKTVNKPYTIAQEVLMSKDLPNQDVNITRLLRGAVYTSHVGGGGSVNDPSMTLGLDRADLNVPPMFETENIPAFCYEDPTNTETGYTAITVYDHTEAATNPGEYNKLVFRSFSNGDAVSNANDYTLMAIKNEGNASCISSPGWEMFAEFGSSCDVTTSATVKLWNANTVTADNNAQLDTATDTGLVDYQREFTITLAAKTFGEIKVAEAVDVANGAAPIVDHAHRSPNQDYNTTVADIHANAPDTPLRYWLLPHNTGFSIGRYDYYGSDFSMQAQQADPIAWYVSVAPQGMGPNQIDYSVQVNNTNRVHLYTKMDGYEPDTEHQGVEVWAWYTNSGNVVPQFDCNQSHNSIVCDQDGLPNASGYGYMGIGWIGGLQDQSVAPINPTDFTSIIEFASDRTGGKLVQVWPFDYESGEACPAKLEAENTGYWQFGGYHAMVSAKYNERVSTVLRISNGLNEGFGDRNSITEPTPAHSYNPQSGNYDAYVGYNDQTNIARAADVYFRVTTEDGKEYAVYDADWKIEPNSTKVIKLLDIMKKVNPTFTENSTFMGSLEIFINNDAKNITIDALENVKGSTDSRTLNVKEMQTLVSF